MENKARVETLKKPADFANLRNSGQKFKIKDWLLVVHTANDQHALRLGLTIPKYVGPAVVRNRLRRWCKEYFRNQKHEVVFVDVNFVFLKKAAGFFRSLPHDQLDSALSQSMRKIGQSR